MNSKSIPSQEEKLVSIDRQSQFYEKLTWSPSKDLMKVDRPEILGDIMKANWAVEGDIDGACI